MSTGRLRFSPSRFPGAMDAGRGPAGNPGPMHHPHYHGGWPPPYPYAHGYCHSCCHPAPLCMCGFRECRKEAKELLVTPEQDREKLVQKIRLQPEPIATVLHGVGFGEAVRKAEAEFETGAETNVESERVIGTPDAFKPGMLEATELRQVARAGVGLETAFIGGGCCVHLSIEYTSTNPNAIVAVGVLDSEQTILAWGKYQIQPGYYIKEGIITTNPGAQLYVVVVNAIARVRWCEVFSC